MATAKPPFIPDPPLEVGIAQYPTPLVPDYYTRDGHIILVEKVSIEKGSYNPQPLDGSVVYDKRDANDWPTNLYLVFQQTEPTGKFVFNYWANDRTLASQDPWNYGLAYSLNHPDYKIVTRTYITPREDYAPVALGSTDPVFGGTAIISKQEMVELPDDNPLRSRYVQVQRVYETIPSSIITGKRVTERGDIETLDTQVVVAGTAPDADGLLVTQTAIESIDAVKSKRTKGSVASYSTLTTKAKRAGLLGEVSVSDDIVSPATNPDALSTTIIDSTVEAISATKSRKRTTTATGPTSLSGLQNKAGLLGSSSIVESIVAAGANADALSLSVISSEVVSIDSAKSKKRTETASGPTSLEGKVMSEFGIASVTDSIVTSGTSVSPTRTTIKAQVDSIDTAKSKNTLINYDATEVLDGYQYDADLGLIVHTTKELIDEGTAPLSPTNGTIAYKDEPLNAWQSIRIQSKISSLPTQRIEYKTGAYASPNLIYGFNVSAPQMPNWDINVSVTPVMRAKRSYQTVFKSITNYQYEQPEPSYTLYDPVSVNVYYDGYFFKINIPDCLTDPMFAISFTTASNDPIHGYINETYSVPASDESASGYLAKVGTYQLIAYEIDYWKANIWRKSEQWVLLK
jgi:hypothetical protein